MLTSNRRRRCDTQVELLQLCPTDRIVRPKILRSHFFGTSNFALGDDVHSESHRPSLSFCCSIGDAHWPSLLFGACSEMLIKSYKKSSQ